MFLGITFFVGVVIVLAGNFGMRSTKTLSMYDDNFYAQSDGFMGSAPERGLMYEEPYIFDEFSNQSEYETQESRLIKTGSINVEVDDIDNTLELISDIVKSYPTSIMDLNDYGRGLDRMVSLTIRVEQSKFEMLYDEIQSLEGEFYLSSISVSDVTETIVDLETRLNNYRNVEAQFLRILESAETVEDTLAVYNEINRVRLEIERIEVQLKNLETQTDYSYIYVNISQSSVGAELKDEKWRPVGVFRDALRSLVLFGQFLGSLFIWIVVFIPVILVFVVPIIIIRKKRKKIV